MLSHELIDLACYHSHMAQYGIEWELKQYRTVDRRFDQWLKTRRKTMPHRMAEKIRCSLLLLHKIRILQFFARLCG